MNPRHFVGGSIPQRVWRSVWRIGPWPLALSAAIATLIMGLYAKLPFVLAPGMGINAYFAFHRSGWVWALTGEWPWRRCSLKGIIFHCPDGHQILRSKIVEAIPEAVKHATTAGIGMFIAYIALKSAGIIVASEATFYHPGGFALSSNGGVSARSGDYGGVVCPSGHGGAAVGHYRHRRVCLAVLGWPPGPKGWWVFPRLR